MKKQNDQTATVEVTTEQVAPTEAVTENVSETTSVVNAQPTESFGQAKARINFDTKKFIMILSIVGLAFFFLWFIVTNSLISKEDESYVFGKTGDGVLKAFASLIIIISSAIFATLICELIKLIKAKKDKKTTACWGSALSAVMVAIFVTVIILIVEIAAKEKIYGYEFDKWYSKRHFVQCCVGILSSINILTLVGSLTAKKSANFGKFLAMSNVILAGSCLLFFIFATSFEGASTFNDWTKQSDSAWSLATGGIYAYYMVEILAGILAVTLSGQLALLVVNNYKNLTKPQIIRIVLLSIVIVLLVVFVAILATKLNDSNFWRMVYNNWYPEINEEEGTVTEYVWKKNVLFATFATAGAVLGGVTEGVFERKHA